jgi:hypothetical protein
MSTKAKRRSGYELLNRNEVASAVNYGSAGRFRGELPKSETRWSAGGRRRTRCHSREDRGVYTSGAVIEKRPVENDRLTCT